MSSMEALRSSISGTGHARHPEVPGVFHLVELRPRNGLADLEEFPIRMRAIATLHGSIYKYGIKLCGYNIQPERGLLVLIPELPGAISLALADAERALVRRFDHDCMPIWERKYHICPFDDEVAWRVLRYVDLASLADGANPLDAHALNSAAEHAGMLKHGLLTAPADRLPNPVVWPVFITSPEDREFAQVLELCLQTDRPFGSAQLVRGVKQPVGGSARASGFGSPRLHGGGIRMQDPRSIRPIRAIAESLAL